MLNKDLIVKVPFFLFLVYLLWVKKLGHCYSVTKQSKVNVSKYPNYMVFRKTGHLRLFITLVLKVLY